MKEGHLGQGGQREQKDNKSRFSKHCFLNGAMHFYRDCPRFSSPKPASPATTQLPVSPFFKHTP